MKIRKRFLSVAVSCAIPVLISTSALAADFILKVPLDVRNLDEGFPSARLRCEVSAMTNGTRTIVGRGSADIAADPNTGNLPVTQAEVPISVNAGNDPRAVDRYSCQLYLLLKGIQSFEPIDCTNQLLRVSTTDELTRVPVNGRDVLVRDMSKPCRSIVEGNVPRS